MKLKIVTDKLKSTFHCVKACDNQVLNVRLGNGKVCD